MSSTQVLEKSSTAAGGDGLAVSAHTWATKYLNQLQQQDAALADQSGHMPPDKIAERLRQEVRNMCLQGWKDTENLLAREVVRHQIDADLIDPWEISKDAFDLFEKALTGYADQISLAQLAVKLSDDIGAVRQKYTETDPRVIGFISMQFFYTGQNLLKLLDPAQQPDVHAYFNVISDHLYMPLKRAFSAAGEHHSGSPQLKVVHQLLPQTTAIAKRIVAKVLASQGTYVCHSGVLNAPAIQISSVRDVEMFQVYLMVCILENNLSAIQDELFPLCVMLYPRLRVGWELIRQMGFLLGKELQTILTPEQMLLFKPFHEALWSMFSPEVFPEVVFE
jgi:hypothetical protein